MNVTKIVASKQPHCKIYQSLGRKIKKRELPIYLENWPPSFQSSKWGEFACKLLQCIASDLSYFCPLNKRHEGDSGLPLPIFEVKQELFMHSTIYNNEHMSTFWAANCVYASSSIKMQP